MPLLLADHRDGPAAQAPEAGDDRLVVAELAVAGKRREIVDDGLHIGHEMRPVRMPGDLRLLPGRQLGIDLRERLAGLGFEALDLLADGDGIPALAHGAELLDLALEIGDGLLEFQKGAH